MVALAVAGTETTCGPDKYARLLGVVQKRTGLELDAYKERFIERRVAIRVRATGRQGLDDYLSFLERDDAEVERLLRCLTINVSSFFRNPSTFDAIRGQVFPQLFAPGASRHLRFWSVGCARGEEPYTLAILVDQHLGAARRGWDVQIEAVDVDDRVLEDAKRGEYTVQQVAGLDAEARARYLIPHAGHWRVSPAIRRIVRFYRSDILMEPPRGEYDFVLCRNLLIYLDRPGQEAVLERFARCLRPGGYLVLGRTEIFVGAGRGAFEPVDPRERIYRRLRAAGTAPEPSAAHEGRT